MKTSTVIQSPGSDSGSSHRRFQADLGLPRGGMLLSLDDRLVKLAMDRLGVAAEKRPQRGGSETV